MWLRSTGLPYHHVNICRKRTKLRLIELSNQPNTHDTHPFIVNSISILHYCCANDQLFLIKRAREQCEWEIATEVVIYDDNGIFRSMIWFIVCYCQEWRWWSYSWSYSALCYQTVREGMIQNVVFSCKIILLSRDATCQSADCTGWKTHKNIRENHKRLTSNMICAHVIWFGAVR